MSSQSKKAKQRSEHTYQDMDRDHPGKSSREYKAQRKRYDKKKLSVTEFADKWGHN